MEKKYRIPIAVLLILCTIMTIGLLADLTSVPTDTSLSPSAELVQTTASPVDIIIITPTAAATAPPQAPAKSSVPARTSASSHTPVPAQALNVSFIDVGQADSALLVCGGEAMLIDGGNPDNGSAVVQYIKQAGVTALKYVVCTHAHEDHVGGLSTVLKNFKAQKILAPVSSNDSAAWNDFKTQADKQGGICVTKAGDKLKLGAADIAILAPTVIDGDNANNTSIIMRVSLDKISFLFTGDAEREEEQTLSAAELNSTVLKVGHHGSNTSTSYVFLRSIMPQYAVISVGKNNSYSHPSDEVLSRLHDAEVQVLRTDEVGTVCMRTDGKTITVSSVKAQPVTAAPSPTTGGLDNPPYIGNINTHVFHKSTCHSLPAEKNRIYFPSRDSAVAQEYRPCSKCNP